MLRFPQLHLAHEVAHRASDYGLCAVGGSAGQATRIAAATGGSHTTGVDATEIVTTLAELIAAAVSSTGSVTLVPSASIAPFVESIAPAGYGPLPGDVEHVLPFTVTWTGSMTCAEKDQELPTRHAEVTVARPDRFLLGLGASHERLVGPRTPSTTRNSPTTWTNWTPPLRRCRSPSGCPQRWDRGCSRWPGRAPGARTHT